MENLPSVVVISGAENKKSGKKNETQYRSLKQLKL